jgi:2-keto-4-pentenoate hydratase/2-oxohepta-3-ene-1,7-dioic acid hydratase in catechol pathway
MKFDFRGIVRLCVCVTLGTGSMASAADTRPYKLGTFEAEGRTFVGAVVDDAVVIDLGAAASALRSPANAAPRDMRDLIARYNNGVRDLIVASVAAVTAQSGGARPSYAMDLGKVRTLAPVIPMTMMNVAVNYYEHAAEMNGGSAATSAPPGTTSVPGLWERKPDDKRWNPYLFLKAPAAIIGAGEAIRIPPARDEIDWECEMAVVIGKPADHVPLSEANQHIFGYTVHVDVSDRSGQRSTRFGTDWLVGKSHATFAPLGPFIVPREFVPDPQKLKITYTLNGKVMQDADTSLMVHSIVELVSYGSNILPLQPGDVINTGSPAGVGYARKPPIFLKAGDQSSCTYASIGTLVNPVAASR